MQKPTVSAANGTKIDLLKAFGCVVAGTPSEFPDDLQITNIGLAPIAGGTRIAWSIKAPRASGKFVLNHTVAPGEGFSIFHAVAGGAQAGTPCSVTFR